MANNKLRVLGLEELRVELRNLAPHLREEAKALVFAKGDEAKAAIIAEYHEGPTGNLRRGVTAKKEYGTFSVAVLIRSRAKHAWLYEHGSQARHTDLGANRGAMPARPTFEPIMARKRRELQDDLIALVERQGLSVVKIA